MISKVSKICMKSKAKEKMEEFFKEKEIRELETKLRGNDAKMVNPIFRMGDE